jgi:hypothetical protein
VGVAGGDTVVDLGECDPDIDVLGPEHRLLVRGEWAHGGVTAGERVQDHHGGVEVDHHLLVGGDAGPSAYTSRSARALDPGRAGEPREGAAERQPGRRGGQVEPVDPEAGSATVPNPPGVTCSRIDWQVSYCGPARTSSAMPCRERPVVSRCCWLICPSPDRTIPRSDVTPPRSAALISEIGVSEPRRRYMPSPERSASEVPPGTWHPVSPVDVPGEGRLRSVTVDGRNIP